MQEQRIFTFFTNIEFLLTSKRSFTKIINSDNIVTGYILFICNTNLFLNARFPER